MKPLYPRIVANGEWFRIETSPKVYDRYIPFGTMSLHMPIWETRVVSRAIERLAAMRRAEAHANPDNWKPVL